MTNKLEPKMESDDTILEFVMHEPNVALSRENFSKIRRHAMKAVGAARRGPELNTMARYNPLQRRLLRPRPHSDLDLVVKDYCLDPMDLSALTSVHIGTIASAAIRSQPNQLGRVLSCRQRSYLSFVPPRLGHLAALDDAFQCLVTAAQSTLVATEKKYDSKVLANYDKALRSLQSAVNDPQARQTPEVLCAVSLLALFEILKPSNVQLWQSHIAGASLLVQLRGPQGFTSEFDKALLTGLCYPISIEALFNNNKCFLDNQLWAAAIEDSTDSHEIFTDRSPLGVALMLLMTKIPGLVKRVSHVVVVAALQDGKGNEQDWADVIDEANSFRYMIMSWRRDFNTALIHAVGDTNEDSTTENIYDPSKRYELLGIFLVVHMLATRMLVSLSPPKDSGALLLEDEAQVLAAELKDVQGSVSSHGDNHRAGFVLRQKAQIADAVIATHDNFRHAAARVKGRFVEPCMLNEFYKALGRRYCDGNNCCL